MKIFRFLPELNAFDVTPEYRELSSLVGLAEWNPVVWIGRLFSMDNDVGEHWFDNWDARERISAQANQLGLDANVLLIVDPDRFQDGSDGPCNSPEFRSRFWTEVLRSLDLSTDLLFDKARQMNAQLKALIDAGDTELQEDYIPDLEARIATWKAAHDA